MTRVDEILDDLKKSGFPLEIEVGSLFSNRGWTVRHQAIFKDSGEEPKYVDLLATKVVEGAFGQYNRVVFMVVCECKKSEKMPWVFYIPGGALQVPKDLASIFHLKILSEPPIGAADRVSLGTKTRHVVRDPQHRLAQASHLAFWQDKAGRGRGDYNQINGAINQVLKASTYQIQSIAKMIPLATGVLMLVIPLIVVDGTLFEYNLGQDGEPTAKEMSYVKYQATVIGSETTVKLPNERTEKYTPQEDFLIDIVDKKTLPDYIDWLEEDMKLITS